MDNFATPPLDWPHYGIKFGGAVKRGYRKTFNPRGRASLGEYWWFVLFVLLTAFGLTGLDFLVGGAASESGSNSGPLAVMAAVFYMGSLVPLLTLTIRRLHDTGRSGWFYLCTLIPCVGSFVVFVMLCGGTRPAAERFGPPYSQGAAAGTEGSVDELEASDSFVTPGPAASRNLIPAFAAVAFIVVVLVVAVVAYRPAQLLTAGGQRDAQRAYQTEPATASSTGGAVTQPPSTTATQTPIGSETTSAGPTTDTTPFRSTGQTTGLQLGESAVFTHFTTTVTAISDLDGQSVGIWAEVCVSSLPPDPQGDRTRISWDPWAVTAGGKRHRPSAAAGARVTNELFPADAIYRVGECAAGWIPFADLDDADVTKVRYRNGVGDAGTWDTRS